MTTPSGVYPLATPSGNAWDTATRGFVGLVNEVLMYNTGIRTSDFTPPTAPFAEAAC